MPATTKSASAGSAAVIKPSSTKMLDLKVVVGLLAVAVATAGRSQIPQIHQALSAEFERFWRYNTATYTLFQLCLFGSAALHMALSVILNIWPAIVQNVPAFQKYKLQRGPPASIKDWGYVIKVACKTPTQYTQQIRARTHRHTHAQHTYTHTHIHTHTRTHTNTNTNTNTNTHKHTHR